MPDSIPRRVLFVQGTSTFGGSKRAMLNLIEALPASRLADQAIGTVVSTVRGKKGEIAGHNGTIPTIRTAFAAANEFKIADKPLE